jgi:hypothetical protein
LTQFKARIKSKRIEIHSNVLVYRPIPPTLQVNRSYLAILFALGIIGCGPSAPVKAVEPVYNKTTGNLLLLKYDSDGDGKIDTVSYMDGGRILRIEIDKDADGNVDRWEYYGPDQALEKVGFSRTGDGIEDAWSFAGAGGVIVRIDVSTRRDGKPNRFEHFEKDVLVRAEEDVDGDGQIDKWETYSGSVLSSVAFDETHRGRPDRRLIYGADGSARLEVDPAGDGHFVAAPSTSSAR